jgi:hypothetical protein
VPLTDPPTVTAGTQYAVVLSAPGVTSASPLYAWGAALGNPYAAGDALTSGDSGASWFPLIGLDNTPLDRAFRTYMRWTGSSSPQLLSSPTARPARRVNDESVINELRDESDDDEDDDRTLTEASQLIEAAMRIRTVLGCSQPGSATGFSGVWTSIDCATWWEETPEGHLIDCNRWGDGSALTLIVGKGASPHVLFRDSLESGCAARPTGRVGLGKGRYFEIWLLVEPLTERCGRSRLARSMSLYHDPGSDTLWEDEDGDGWGLTWHRAS